MIKRVIASLGLLLCLCFTAMANKEVTVKLDGNDRIHSEQLGFAYLDFEYLYSDGNNARVRVTVENITINPPHAVLLFRNDMSEKALKKGKPKIELEKTFPGEKGSRMVKGFIEAEQYIDIIPATESGIIFTIDVPFTSSKDFTLPLYEAKYKAKDLHKKRKKMSNGEYSIKYKILEEHLYDVHIEVVGWSEDDSTYVRTKNGVDSFISWLEGVEFCSNKRHRPSTEDQQRPYQVKKDSLINVITNILDIHSEWMSKDAPHKAYSQLLAELNKVNLDDMTKDCGKHGIPPIPRCSLCSLSAQEIYRRLDDLYQQLYVGKIDKEQALSTANSLYNCYQRHKKRKKDNSYRTKISRVYNSIAKY